MNGKMKWAAVIAVGLAYGMVGSAFADSQYDGTYSGMLTYNWKASDQRGCEAGAVKKQMIIKNGALDYLYNRVFDVHVTGTVSPDGLISASGTSSAGGTKLDGRIQGNVITGTIGSAYCSYSFQFTK